MSQFDIMSNVICMNVGRYNINNNNNNLFRPKDTLKTE